VKRIDVVRQQAVGWAFMPTR